MSNITEESSPQTATSPKRQSTLQTHIRDLHVLHVLPATGLGGMELVLSRLIPELTERGITHSVVCIKGQESMPEMFPSAVSIHCMDARPHELFLPWRLRKILKIERPDVIHARNWGSWPDPMLARLMVSPRLPFVFSFHGLTTTERMPRRRRIACRILARMTTEVLVVSEPSGRMLARDIGLPAERISMIPNGVDTGQFCPAPPRPARKQVVLGTAGGLKPVKNHALLIRVLADLTAAGQDCELRIAGDGPERENLERLIARLGLTGRANLIGQCSDMPAFLADLDVFVLPSDSESHPNALLEAMACGLPCVATSVGGVPDVLDDGAVGVLVSPGQASEISAAIADLVRQPERRQALGAAARDRVCDLYDLDRMVEAYAKMYRRLSRKGRS